MSFFHISTYDMQMENDYLNHYNEFRLILVFVILFGKIVGAL